MRRLRANAGLSVVAVAARARPAPAAQAASDRACTSSPHAATARSGTRVGRLADRIGERGRTVLSLQLATRTPPPARARAVHVRFRTRRRRYTRRCGY
ncbi:hypothetical protein DFH11DRAFT_1571035 [Phellopilus nigrolimitatus]|nr:hypothetical protein DFH11DRAFT_1571035 [Phellopilus nigrolimitatus]